MTAPLPLPLRVLVKGASTVIALGDRDWQRDDLAFPRAMERAVLQSGRPVEVRVSGVASERTKTALTVWEREVLAWSPDVVVLVYGHYECIHLVLPWWLERHANSLKRRRSPLRDLYRDRLLRKVWVSLAALQSKLDARLDPTFRRRHKQVVRDLDQLIRRTYEAGHPLVLLPTLPAPTGKATSWFPGMARRIDVMNAAVADLVRRLDDPNVRTFAVPPVAATVTPEGMSPTPDGFHYSADVHRAIGEAMAGEVLDWAATQPHLK
ncbi:SGNH/GDSL hydrolase family protein [Jatrophihabitans fulvus]